MKQTILVLATIIALISCGDKKKAGTETNSTETKSSSKDESDSDKTASFTIDGTAFKGKITTQNFEGGAKNFSVLCQQDDPFCLFQVVFANEKEATGNGGLKPAGSFYNVETGLASVTVSGTAVGAKEFTTTSSSPGTITVDGRKLIIKDLKLYDQDKKEKTVSGTFEY